MCEILALMFMSVHPFFPFTKHLIFSINFPMARVFHKRTYIILRQIELALTTAVVKPILRYRFYPNYEMPLFHTPG